MRGAQVRPIRNRDTSNASPLPDSIPKLLRRIYAARGVTSPKELQTSLDGLLPVGSLEGVDRAAELVLAHRDGRVLVIGDFDADGATSTALMLRALTDWGFRSVDFLVPDRFKFGYGLTPGIVEEANARSPTLIITVDNGMSSHEGVAAARTLGIAVLITDHHLPGAALPAADAIVNPNLSGSGFGSRALAGVGVAFYVLAALQRLLQSTGIWLATNRAVTHWLDLVALGTVADLVALDTNNRILVEQGLRRIRVGQCVPGIRALLEIAKRSPADLVAADLGFAVGPRLNAAGRLDDMSIGIRCLLSDDPVLARGLALELDVLNRQRREIEASMQAQAQAAVRHVGPLTVDDHRAALCLFDAKWHQGVVGLVASRIKDRVGRPVVAFAPAGDGAQLRGSARSIPGIHIRDVFEAMASRDPGLIVRFGGHAMAAGLTLNADRLDEFARRFEAEVAEWMRRIDPEDAIWTDGVLEEMDIALDTAQLLRAAGPWGQSFPEPSFDGEFDIESTRIVGERHVKFWLRPVGSTLRFDAIAFNLLEAEGRRIPPAGRVRLAYRLDVNHYQGERRLQLLIDHLQEAPQ